MTDKIFPVTTLPLKTPATPPKMKVLEPPLLDNTYDGQCTVGHGKILKSPCKSLERVPGRILQIGYPNFLP